MDAEEPWPGGHGQEYEMLGYQFLDESGAMEPRQHYYTPQPLQIGDIVTDSDGPPLIAYSFEGLRHALPRMGEFEIREQEVRLRRVATVTREGIFRAGCKVVREGAKGEPLTIAALDAIETCRPDGFVEPSFDKMVVAIKALYEAALREPRQKMAGSYLETALRAEAKAAMHLRDERWGWLASATATIWADRERDYNPADPTWRDCPQAAAAHLLSFALLGDMTPNETRMCVQSAVAMVDASVLPARQREILHDTLFGEHL